MDDDFGDDEDFGLGGVPMQLCRAITVWPSCAALLGSDCLWMRERLP
jgi:hypothetical protein